MTLTLSLSLSVSWNNNPTDGGNIEASLKRVSHVEHTFSNIVPVQRKEFSGYSRTLSRTSGVSPQKGYKELRWKKRVK